MTTSKIVRITSERARIGRSYYSDLLVNGVKVASMPSSISDWSLKTPDLRLITKAFDAAGVVWTFEEPGT